MSKNHDDHRFLAPYVRAFFADHLTCHRNVAGKTIQSYRDAVKLFLLHVAAQLKKPVAALHVNDIDVDVMHEFLAHLERDRSNSIQTRNHRLIVVRSLFTYIAGHEPRLAEECRRVCSVPVKLGVKRRDIIYLETDEVMALLQAVDRASTSGRRDYALLLFLYNSGARVEEAAQLRASWLSLHKPYKAELLGKGRKWRTCPLWDTTAGALRELIAATHGTQAASDHVFVNRWGQQLTRFGIARIIQKYAAKAGAEMPSVRAKRITPHTFRHTTAMHLLQSGVEMNVIRSWLGHADVSTTHRYIEIDLRMKSKALESCAVPQGRPCRAAWHSKPDLLAWLKAL